MSKVYITQLLCPKRHAILGLAWEEDQLDHDRAVGLIKDGIRVMKVNPWCGICGSRDLKYESGATIFSSVDEAMPHLMQLVAENLMASSLLGRFSTGTEQN